LARRRRTLIVTHTLLCGSPNDIDCPYNLLASWPTVLQTFTSLQNTELQDEGRTSPIPIVRMMTRGRGYMVNDAVIQGASDTVPSGGVGGFGYGAHRGLAGIDMFTHNRTMTEVSDDAHLIPTGRYAPYDLKKYKAAQRLMKVSIPWAKPGTRPSFFQSIRGNEAWLRPMSN